MSDEQISQDEIEALLSGGAGSPNAPEPKAPEPETQASLDQDEIEALISGSPTTDSTPMASAPGTPSAAAAAGAPVGNGPSDMEFLLNQAEQAIASINEPTELPPGVQPFSLADFSSSPPSSEAATIELVRDVQLDLKIELGRTHMQLEDVLRMRSGSVVTLDKMAGDPVDVFVNGRLIARGEVLVLNDNFCVRVTELVAGETAVA